MPQTSIGRLRLAGIVEAISFLVLLGIAMPLKYVWDEPMPVRIVGWIHGVLFILFCFALNGARTEHDWPVSKSAKVMIAALLPFGPFVIDHGLKEEDTTSVDA